MCVLIPWKILRNFIGLFVQYDKKWVSDRGFVFYDFNDLETIPKDMHGTFDLLVVDPPFIVKEVWEKYAAAVKLLAKEGTDSEGKSHYGGSELLPPVIDMILLFVA